MLDRTGVYRQAFYDNFADKDDCYLQAYDAGVERVEALLREAPRARGAAGRSSSAPGCGRCSTSSTPSPTSAGR